MRNEKNPKFIILAMDKNGKYYSISGECEEVIFDEETNPEQYASNQIISNLKFRLECRGINSYICQRGLSENNIRKLFHKSRLKPDSKKRYVKNRSDYKRVE